MVIEKFRNDAVLQEGAEPVWLVSELQIEIYRRMNLAPIPYLRIRSIGLQFINGPGTEEMHKSSAYFTR